MQVGGRKAGWMEVLSFFSLSVSIPPAAKEGHGSSPPLPSALLAPAISTCYVPTPEFWASCLHTSHGVPSFEPTGLSTLSLPFCSPGLHVVTFLCSYNTSVFSVSSFSSLSLSIPLKSIPYSKPSLFKISRVVSVSLIGHWLIHCPHFLLVHRYLIENVCYMSLDMNKSL